MREKWFTPMFPSAKGGLLLSAWVALPVDGIPYRDMVIHMKTTFNISEETMREVKREAEKLYGVEGQGPFDEF
jgi:hypothetical protein